MNYCRFLPTVALILGIVSPLTAQVDDTLAIQKAAILRLMGEKTYHTTGTVAVVCLSAGTARPPVKGIQIPLVNYVDPASALVKKLAGSKYPIVPGSRCQADPTRAFAIVDSASRPKRTAMAIIFSPVRIGQDGRASLLIERAFDNASVMGFMCIAAKANGLWKIERCEDTWDSLR